MQFKEMTDDTLRDAAKLFTESFNSPPWNDQWKEEIAFARLSAMAHAERAFGLCMYDKGRLLGIVLGHLEEYDDGTEFLLKEFAVDNESRGKGLGTIMMEEVKNRLKAQNTRRIVLVTIADDQTTSFYQQQGFEEDRKAVVMKTEL